MFFRVATALLVPVFLLTFALGYWIYNNEQFLNNIKITKKVKIEKNERFSNVYNKIFEGVKTPFLFEYYLKKVKRFPEKMRFGYYEADNITISEFLKRIEDGKESVFKITIPEGFTIADIAIRLKEDSDIDVDRFLKLTKDKDFILKLTGNPFKTLEGFLYPDTYFFKTDTTPEIFIGQAYMNFKSKLPPDFEEKVNAQGLTFYEGIILASIIQKETFVESEYPIIASVFFNRLKKGIPLQSDPTIIYGLGDKFDGNLKRSHLQDSSNLYNTYIHKGLPPSPICNPSIGAIKGVMEPAKTPYIYFVAKKDGTHQFSIDYQTHLLNIKKYQLSR